MSVIPAEHRGLARLFREQVIQADRRLNAVLPRITQPLEQRLKRKPTLRPELLHDISRLWLANITDQFSVDGRAKADKRELTIAELRACGARWSTVEWDGDTAAQPGVSLVWIALKIENGRLHLDVRPAAHLLMHALARRFERGYGRTTADVMRDLRMIAAVLDTPAHDIPVIDGYWAGDREVAANDTGGGTVSLLHIKTFLN
jgi:hypothetical protein